MKKSILGLLSLFLVVSFTSNAQKVKLVKGSLDVLKSETLLNVEFIYDDFGVGKFKKEKDYTDKKVSEYNADEAGRGDKWLAAWNSDKQGRYPAKFIELYDKAMNKAGKAIINLNQSGTKYTMIVETTFLEPGFNAYVVKEYANCNLTIKIVETANKSNVIAELTIYKSPGRTYGFSDFDTGIRISEAFAAAGKALSKYVLKALK